MQCKIFTGENGYLKQNIGANPILLEDTINNFLAETFPNDIEAALSQCRILQSQSGENGNFTTITFFY